MSSFKNKKGYNTENTIDLLLNHLAWLFKNLDSQNVKRLDGNETALTGTWDFTNCDGIDNLITSTSAKHDHNIPNGTVLMVSGGGTVTFQDDGDHSHDVEV